MIVTVFGASGTVGKQIVKQALWKGHSVKAVGRNLFDLGFEHENLKLISAALFDDQQVYDAIKGSDAVLSSLGGGLDGTDKTRSLGMKKIIEQMTNAGVKRIIAVGGIGILDGDDGKYILESPVYPEELVPVAKEHLLAFQYLQASSLDWTLVCPPAIAAADPKGDFILSVDIPTQETQESIHSGDIALFMIEELSQNKYINKRVGIGEKL